MSMTTSHTAAAGQTEAVPEMMQAALRHRYGGSEELQVTQMPARALRPDTVMVEVVSAALNPLDRYKMTGTPWLMRSQLGVRAPKSPMLGIDVAGRVVAVGEDVTEFEPGDEVAGFGSGVFADYVATTADMLTTKPTTVSFDQVAGLGVAGLTALQGLRDKGEVAAGHKVLINGAAGGVGTAAVQIAHWMGAEVTAVCSSRNVELIRSLGADHVVDYTTDDFTDTEQRYHVIFDNQGNKPLGRIRRILNDDGIYLPVGGSSKNRLFGPMGRMAAATVRFMFSRKSVRPFIARQDKQDLTRLADLMAADDLKTVVDTVYSLTEIRAAMDHLATGHVRGKVIIKP